MIGEIFTVGLMNPLVNLLVFLTGLLGGSFGLAIIAFTILVRVATFPLTLGSYTQHVRCRHPPKIQRSTRRYSDPKRPRKGHEAVSTSGANPGASSAAAPHVPDFIALYSAIRMRFRTRHEALEKPQATLRWSFLSTLCRWKNTFGGGPSSERGESIIGYVFVALVAGTTWIQSKTTVTASTDDRVRAQMQMTNVMLPFMFGFFALSFPVGVSLYWVVNSLAQIGFNILTYGFAALGIEPVFKPRAPTAAPQAALAGPEASAAPTPARELRTANGSGRSKRQNRRRRP